LNPNNIKGFGDSRLERVEGQATEAALPGRLHFAFLRYHGTLEPRFGLGFPGTGIRSEEIVFHFQSKKKKKKFFLLGNFILFSI
jgi:hypothetical protein